MGLRLGLLLFSVFFLLGFLILSIFHYNRKFNTSYKIRNYFPYELNYDSYFTDNAAGNFAMIFMSFCLLGFFATFDLSYNNSFLIAIMIFGILLTITIPVLVLTPLKYLKAHIAIVITQFLLSVCLPASIAIASLKSYQDADGGAIAIISLIGSTMVAVFFVILALNPRLSLNIRMDEKIDENGQKQYVRPKAIPLAFTEWMFILSIFIDAIFIFVLKLA